MDELCRNTVRGSAAVIYVSYVRTCVRACMHACMHVCMYVCNISQHGSIMFTTSICLIPTISGVSRVGLRGVSKNRKIKWHVKVGASEGVTQLIIKKIMAGGGGFRATRKPPWIRHCPWAGQVQ